MLIPIQVISWENCSKYIFEILKLVLSIFWPYSEYTAFIMNNVHQTKNLRSNVLSFIINKAIKNQANIVKGNIGELKVT